jgi:small conductance mechanosensitive channel
VELYFSGFGESSIDFIVRFWSRGISQSEFLAARSAAIVAIKRAFDAHDITIPWPIRTLEIGQGTRALVGRALASRGPQNGGERVREKRPSAR